MPRQALTVDDLLRVTQDCRIGVIFFYSPTCPYCRMLEPLFREAARVLGDRMAFVVVDITRSPDLAMMFNVMGTPTLVAFRAGREVDRIVGLPSPEGFEDFIYSLLLMERCPLPAPDVE